MPRQLFANAKRKRARNSNTLNAGGSTAGGAGLRAAYALAEQIKDDSAISRVLLATDGDFNVGISNPEALKSLIETRRDSGT